MRALAARVLVDVEDLRRAVAQRDLDREDLLLEAALVDRLRPRAWCERVRPLVHVLAGEAAPVCAVFQPTVIDMSNAGASGVSGWLGDIHGASSSVPSMRFIAFGERRDALRAARDHDLVHAGHDAARPRPAPRAMPDAQWRLSATPGTSVSPSSIAA